MPSADGLHNFIIVGTQRTGSSALAERISFHPEIACGWEWTETIRRSQKVQAMASALRGDFQGLPEDERKHIHSLISDTTQWLGFRRLFGASNKWLIHPRYSAKLWWDRFETHLKWFSQHPHIRLVHIIRNNNMSWLKSKYMAKSSGAYVGKQYPEELKVTIPVGEAVARLKAKTWIDERLSSMQDSNPYLCVIYEDFAANPSHELMRCFDFLDCQAGHYAEVPGQLNKQANRSDHDYIANFEELALALESSGLAC